MSSDDEGNVKFGKNIGEHQNNEEMWRYCLDVSISAYRMVPSFCCSGQSSLSELYNTNNSGDLK